MVGYGSETDSSGTTQEYILLKNSWGTAWGEQGYVKMLYTASGNGTNGMYLMPLIPTTANNPNISDGATSLTTSASIFAATILTALALF